MKLVFYSNVIFAAFATQGICHSLLEHCLYNHTLFFSEDLINEISIKFQTGIKVPKQLLHEIISFLKNHASIISPKPLEQRICRDQYIENVISLAMTAKSDYVISMDNNLLTLKQYKSIPILTPREFWHILQQFKF